MARSQARCDTPPHDSVDKDTTFFVLPLLIRPFKCHFDGVNAANCAEHALANSVASTNMSLRQLSARADAMTYRETSFSPLYTFNRLCQHADEITPTCERLAKESLKALLAPFPLKCLMDIDDANDCLECVVDKVTTRAAKRKAEAAAAAAADEAAKVRIGEARAAQ